VTYHPNTLDSVFAITDANAQILEGYQYDAYGRHYVFSPGANGVVDFGLDDMVVAEGGSAIDNPHLFTGRRFEVDTAIYCYRQRYFDFDQGRFISRDSIGYTDGINLYHSLGAPSEATRTPRKSKDGICM
jgi:RHS repeat-associated protein